MIVANAMLIIIGRALNMLKSQIEAQGRAFEETGGFSERLTARRIEARSKAKAVARVPAVRQAHAQAKVGQRRFLGLLRLSRLHRHKAGTRAGTAVTTIVNEVSRVNSQRPSHTEFHILSCPA